MSASNRRGTRAALAVGLLALVAVVVAYLGNSTTGEREAAQQAADAGHMGAGAG